MYLSTNQVITSLGRLENVHPFFGFAFLGFKKFRIPIGATTKFSYSFIADEVLKKYFKVLPEYDGYFNPYKSTTRWVSSRYESTSLQRVIADTFGDAFLRDKKNGEWGWSPKYIEILRTFLAPGEKLPLLDMAVWFYRNHRLISKNPPRELTAKFIKEFRLSARELSALFDVDFRRRIVEFSETPPNTAQILNQIGWPEELEGDPGVALIDLALRNVGPVRELMYTPAERLNVIVGDNSLGKSFLLDCVWWSVTGEWILYSAEPSGPTKSASEISYSLASANGRQQSHKSIYNRLIGEWQRPRSVFEGLAIFAMHAGGVAVWDPTGVDHQKPASEWVPHVVFNRNEIWNGMTRKDGAVVISNGLIRDWAMWQSNERRYGHLLEAFETCLKNLSPPDNRTIRRGPLTTIQGDTREMPTIRLPYGNVPIVHASAGIQRVMGLAYMLVSLWHNHVSRAEKLRRKPSNQVVLLLDEIEAHLHPKWQRQILPAFLRTVKSLSKDLEVQVHVATHSPLVLASVEPDFSPDRDQLHHLVLEGRTVLLEEYSFAKQGSVDSWLESDLFGLPDARSQPAEIALNRAQALQLSPKPKASEVREVQKELIRLLPGDDPFWVRWGFFYEQVTGEKQGLKK